MKNNKGFTLIELLAIIVILAIIAVITVPLILGIIDDAKKGVAEDSAYGYKDAVNKFYATELMNNKDFSMQDKTYTIDELSTAGVIVSGNEPEGNSWITIENNNVKSGCLQYDEYNVNITNGNVGKAVKGECESNSSIVIVSGTKGNLQSGDVVRIGDTENFYVVSSDNSANGKTILLAKYNLNVGYDIIMVKGTYGIPTQTKTSIQNLDGVKQDSDFSGCESSDSSCKASLFSSDYYWMDNGPRKLKDQYSNNGAYSHSNENDMFFDSNGQVYPYVYDSNSEIYSYINGENGYLDYLKSLGAPSSITGRLMTVDEALISGCVINESGNNPCTGWITETQFYLGSAISGSASLEISNSAINRTYTVLGSSSNINAGVRPVIEIETSYIK